MTTAVLNPPRAHLGARIARLRRRRGISQVACAGLVGRSEDWLSKVENGHIVIDRLSVLRELARVLRVDLTTLLDGCL
jgi:transcriptional regulator with XRE-family HTH domain